MSPATRFGFAAVVVMPVGLAGCSHTYLFAGDDPPRLTAAGDVIIERFGEPPRRLPVERVLVQDERGRARLPATEEVRAWHAGDVTPDIGLIRVDVSTTGEVWRDWVLPGFGIGAALVVVTIGGLGVVEPAGGDFTMPIMLLMAAALGLEGALIGGAIGALGESGTTDMRLPGGMQVDDPDAPWPAGPVWR